MTAPDAETPPGRTPGWVVVAGMAASVSAFLLFFTWLVRDSLAPRRNRIVRWLA